MRDAVRRRAVKLDQAVAGDDATKPFHPLALPSPCSSKSLVNAGRRGLWRDGTGAVYRMLRMELGPALMMQARSTCFRVRISISCPEPREPFVGRKRQSGLRGSGRNVSSRVCTVVDMSRATRTGGRMLVEGLNQFWINCGGDLSSPRGALLWPPRPAVLHWPHSMQSVALRGSSGCSRTLRAAPQAIRM